jgi:hypothetical protein
MSRLGQRPVSWLRRRERRTIAFLGWAAVVLLMAAVGVGRVVAHHSFGSWVAFVASAGLAGFYSYRIAGRWTDRARHQPPEADQQS